MNAPAPQRSWRAGLRARLRKIQRNRCPLCNGRFGSAPLSLEHVVPKSQGGRIKRNVIVTHADCNKHRGTARATGCMLIWLAAVNARLYR